MNQDGMSVPGFGTQALRLFALSARFLGWSPDLFWAATPAELAAALAPLDDASGGMDRAHLNTLMEQDNAQSDR